MDFPWQIDIITIKINPVAKQTKLQHIEQAIEDFN